MMHQQHFGEPKSVRRPHLQELVTLLKSKRESLTACKSRLKLTAGLTQEICSALYSSQSRTPLEVELVNLLPDIKAIRIGTECQQSQEDSTDPSCQTVNLSPFHHLTHLEVVGPELDISKLIHLSKLRSSLKHLVLSGCLLDSLDRVLVQCGGDHCLDSFLWSELHSLHVTGCPSLDLGTGLQLAPWLKTLDLSFNSLDDNAILQSLSMLLTLHHLTLNFNHLQKIPFLAPSAQSSLKVLHLRQNQLESLKGLEELTSLEELDVAYNCITTSEAVSSLCSLPHLVRLCLEVNPISYSKDYRFVVLRRVSTAVNKKRFQLDGRELSQPEKEVLGTMAALYLNQHQPSVVEIVIQAEESSSVVATYRTPSNFPATPVNGSSLTQSAPRSKRKASRMREVEIVDTEDDVKPLEQHSPVVEPATPITDGENHLLTKQRLEELRKTFGPDWMHSQAGNQVRQLLGWETLEPSIHASPVLAEPRQLNVDKEEEEEEEEQLHPLESTVEEEDADDDLHVYVVQRQSVDGDSVERLLTVSADFIREKDSLSGQTICSWHRSTVESLSVLVTGSSSIRFQFVFHNHHSSPARQANAIWIIEEGDFTEFENLVVPRRTTVAAAKPSALNPGLEQQCLRCNQKFPLSRAAVKLRTCVTSPMQGQLEEYPVCPFCDSDMIFAVECSVSPASVVSSESSSSSSSSSGSGSDVLVGVVRGGRMPSSDEEDEDDESEEGSVEVVDKTAVQTPTNTNILFKTPKPLLLKKSTGTPSRSGSQSSGSHKTSSVVSTPASPAGYSFTYSYADFSQVDHRLRLYSEMHLLAHPNEEFHGLIKAELVTMAPNTVVAVDDELTPQPVLLVITSHKMYFLKITANPSNEPDKWLQPESSFLLSHLTSLMATIGYQGLVIQFQSATVNLILLRDQRRTKNVAHFIASALEKSGLSVPAVRRDLMIAQWSALDGLVRGDEHLSDSSSGQDVMTSSVTSLSPGGGGVFLFCVTCQVEWQQQQPSATSTSYGNAALMVTSDRIALIRGDPRWLTTDQIEFRTFGVALLSLQQVVNLVSLESFVSRPEQLRCYFLDEASNLEEKWTVSLATREAVDQLIEAVRSPWEAMFSVELEINELDE